MKTIKVEITDEQKVKLDQLSCLLEIPVSKLITDGITQDIKEYQMVLRSKEASVLLSQLKRHKPQTVEAFFK